MRIAVLFFAIATECVACSVAPSLPSDVVVSDTFLSDLMDGHIPVRDGSDAENTSDSILITDEGVTDVTEFDVFTDQQNAQDAPDQSVETGVVLPVENPFCVGGLQGLSERDCYYVPANLRTPATLLIFVHAMVPPDANLTTLERITHDAADRTGYVVYFPKGRAGLCDWDASVRTWLCWPTNYSNVDMYGPTIMSEWAQAQSLLETAIGRPFEKRYVMGFSNGGYFASYIGLDQPLHVDGVGMVASGRWTIDAQRLGTERPPFYIAAGVLDQMSVVQSAQNLAYWLSQRNWQRTLVLHQNRAHEIYIDDLLNAWRAWGNTL